MEIEHKNQNSNNYDDIRELFEINYVYDNKPIKRTYALSKLEDKQSLLESLKKKNFSYF